MPFNEERTAGIYKKEILKYITNSEIKVNAVIDGTTVALNGDNRRIIESGTVMQWVGAPGSSKVRPAPNDGTPSAASIAGVLETTYELWPQTTSANKDDKPVALFTKYAEFDASQLLGYSGNIAAVKAALPTCGFN